MILLFSVIVTYWEMIVLWTIGLALITLGVRAIAPVVGHQPVVTAEHERQHSALAERIARLEGQLKFLLPLTVVLAGAIAAAGIQFALSRMPASLNKSVGVACT